MGVIGDETDGDTGDDVDDDPGSFDEIPPAVTGVVSRPADPDTADEQLATISPHATAANAR
ncbi:MAG: hypothetical protein BGO26_18210 [Actinobacteria bacterium 69-20]|nr:MAG: hypothetical protein BGO26_18210 [Actinobacteria bacterium 69-20]